MSIYSVRQRLSSCRVSTGMLADIEKQILKEADRFYLTHPDDAGGAHSKECRLLIKTKGRTAEYSSVTQLGGGKLPEGIEELIIEYSSMYLQLFHIRIIFHSSISERPVLEISAADAGAKDTVSSIAAVISDAVKEHRNYSSFFHSHFVQLSLLFLFALYWMVDFYLYNYTNYFEPMWLAKNIMLSAGLSLFAVWYIISIPVRRFTTFDTGKQKMINAGHWVFSLLYFAVPAVYFFPYFRQIFH